MIGFLLSLPKDVIRDRIVSFIDLASLSRLDSAATSHPLRWNVLNHILSGSVMEGEITYKKEICKWLTSRNIQLKTVIFPRKTCDADLVQASPALLKASRIELSECNQVSNKGVQELFKMVHSLEIVELEGCSWLTDDTLIALVDKHSHLTELMLSSSPLITNAAIVHVASRCEKLIELQFEDCVQIGDEAMTALGLHEKLYFINCGECPLISEAALLSFIAHKKDNIEKLFTHSNHCVTDRVMQHLASYSPELTELSVLGCVNISDVGYEVMVRTCQELDTLLVGDCDLSTTTLHTISSNISTVLTYLRLPNCLNLSDAAVETIAARAKVLETLVICTSELLTDCSLQSIGLHLLCLTHLEVSGSPLLSIEGIRSLVDGCKHLQYLNFSEDYNLRDNSICEIVMRCTDLTELVCYSISITDQSLEFVAKYCTNLTSIDIGETDVTADGVELLIRSLPKLRKLICEESLGSVIPSSLQQLAQQHTIVLVNYEGDDEDDEGEDDSV